MPDSSGTSAARVVVVGPASWNHLIELDQLPRPEPHMVFANRSVHTVGGTSAGKALNLAQLREGSELHALIADDQDGRRVRDALAAAGVTLHAHPSSRTERHTNLMTPHGERLSIYVDTPSAAGQSTLHAVETALRGADVAVIDLSDLGLTLLERRDCADWRANVWVDLHDYDGVSAYHDPFVTAADVVFMNDDRTNDPWELMSSCLRRGPRLAVCTRGAEGAIALNASGDRYEVHAEPTVVVDTNGAGDAFMAGFLHASLSGADIGASLRQGATQATIALGSLHLHPLIDLVLG
ncbi:carbohydrate kinase family protein [Microbacterium sp. CH-015]|uniref:carbohydrate kinase family protein n=1 Tax=Microbacterium sp. CH-015 TaxID=3406734 RepID=UPI003C746A7B